MEPLGKQTSYAGLLREFWARVESSEDKLTLLTRWAEIRPTRTPARSPHAVRREHNHQRILAAWKGKRCFVCDAFASQEHHIIQIQHGGTNRATNKVWVCTPCHGKIHPFLAEPPATVPVGIVPYMVGTETSDTCPACSMPVTNVAPKLGRRRVAQSTRPILIKAGAQPPYRTVDLHSVECLNKRGLNRLKSLEIGRLARLDTKARPRQAGWTSAAVVHALRQAHG